MIFPDCILPTKTSTRLKDQLRCWTVPALSYIFPKSLAGHSNSFPQQFRGLSCFFFSCCLTVSFAHCLPAQFVLALACRNPSCCAHISNANSSLQVNLAHRNVTRTQHRDCQGSVCCSMCLKSQPNIRAASRSGKNTPCLIKCLRIRLTKRSR